MASNQESGTAALRDSISAQEPQVLRTHKSAARFFWGVLAFATTMSISGNVAHALLHAQGDSQLMLGVAATVALIPPSVLLLATHSVSLLVRTRSSGAVYWSAVAITVVLAAFAFRLSFDALKELAISTGVRDGIAWLWPLSVDLTIAQATVALLSLSRPTGGRLPERYSAPDTGAVTTAAETKAAPAAAPKNTVARAASPARSPAPVAADPYRAARSNVQDISSFHRHDSHVDIHVDPSPPAPAAAIGEVASAGWDDVAETLIRERVTVKSGPEVVEVLRLWDEKVPTTTIATRTGVHRDTVSNIIKAADELLSDARRIRA